MYHHGQFVFDNDNNENLQKNIVAKLRLIYHLF